MKNMLETTSQSREEAILESFLTLVKSPYGNLEGIGRFSHILDDLPTRQKMMDFFSLSPQGEKALADRCLLGQVDFQQLHQLPQQTFGHSYADHMLRNGLKPMLTQATADDPLAFMAAHLQETHDIWHVVTGSDTDKFGEVQLEAFYVAQLGHNRLFLGLLAKNLLKTAMYEVELCEPIMDALTRGWMMGKQAKPLFGIQWNQLWETPLEEVQRSLNICRV